MRDTETKTERACANMPYVYSTFGFYSAEDKAATRKPEPNLQSGNPLKYTIILLSISAHDVL